MDFYFLVPNNVKYTLKIHVYGNVSPYGVLFMSFSVMVPKKLKNTHRTRAS